MPGTSPASSYASFRYVECYVFKAIRTKFWNCRSIDFDLTIRRRDFRKKMAVT
jgi:hypothetical protein